MSLQCKAALVTIAAQRFDPLVQFYTQLLQAPHLYRPNIYAEFQLPGLRLGIFNPKSAHSEFLTAAHGRLSLCLEVIDIEAAIDHFTAMGHVPGEVTIASHGKEFYAYDLEGNRLIVHQSL